MSEPRQLQIQVEGLQNLSETLEEHKGKQIVVMFIGSVLEEGDHIGESWCPDCRDGKHSSRNNNIDGSMIDIIRRRVCSVSKGFKI